MHYGNCGLTEVCVCVRACVSFQFQVLCNNYWRCSVFFFCYFKWISEFHLGGVGPAAQAESETTILPLAAGWWFTFLITGKNYEQCVFYKCGAIEGLCTIMQGFCEVGSCSLWGGGPSGALLHLQCCHWPVVSSLLLSWASWAGWQLPLSLCTTSPTAWMSLSSRGAMAGVSPGLLLWVWLMEEVASLVHG